MADLRAALEEVLGDRALGDSLTRLVIPAYDADRRDVRVLKTSHHERFERDWRMRAVDVALATAAAPTYFQAHELPSGAQLLDGGIWANNPVGLAVVEAIGVLGWDRAMLQVLSLGCSEEAFVPHPRAGIRHLAIDAATLLMQGQSFGSWCTAKILAGPGNVHRVSPVVPKGLFSLDDASMVGRLAGMGEGCARDFLPTFRRRFLLAPREEFRPFHGAPAAPRPGDVATS
ncbi:patatin-like phospholipase family protein [Roseomonas chloroacetimidivorans]|uniref:patatin-like phospholipase family protein n=1 Tax=Roseomonas chloroacetimidivorans TaxID=1766656 RepID=UPI003C755341